MYIVNINISIYVITETAISELIVFYSLKKELEEMKEGNRHLQHELSATKLELKRERDKLSEISHSPTNNANSEQETTNQNNKVKIYLYVKHLFICE